MDILVTLQPGSVLSAQRWCSSVKVFKEKTTGLRGWYLSSQESVSPGLAVLSLQHLISVIGFTLRSVESNSEQKLVVLQQGQRSGR